MIKYMLLLWFMLSHIQHNLIIEKMRLLYVSSCLKILDRGTCIDPHISFSRFPFAIYLKDLNYILTKKHCN